MLRLCTQGSESKPKCSERFRIGVNYWPRKLGLDLWKRFDVDTVQEDFAQLADLGIDYARVFLLWEDFQSKPDSVRCSALAHLLELCDAASAENIKLELLMMSGHFAGISRIPTFLVDETSSDPLRYATLERGEPIRGGVRSPFIDPLARDASLAFVRGVARAVVGHPAVSAYNLGYEPDKLGQGPFDESTYSWFSDLAASIRELDPNRPVTCSLNAEHLTTKEGLRLERAFAPLDFCSLNYDARSPFANCSPTANLAPFISALAAQVTHKPVLLHEWAPPLGQSSMTAERRDVEVANYVSAMLPHLVSQGTHGVVLYSFTDLPTTNALGCTSVPYGIVDEQGRTKPVADAITSFAKTKPKTNPHRFDSLDAALSLEGFYEEPKTRIGELFAAFSRR